MTSLIQWIAINTAPKHLLTRFRLKRASGIPGILGILGILEREEGRWREDLPRFHPAYLNGENGAHWNNIEDAVPTG